MKVFLEILRIIVIFGIFNSVLGVIINYLYLQIGTDTHKFGWLAFISLWLLFLVWYRNKLQFTGWYTGKGRVMLPKRVTQWLIFSSIVLLLLPPILSLF